MGFYSPGNLFICGVMFTNLLLHQELETFRSLERGTVSVPVADTFLPFSWKDILQQLRFVLLFAHRKQL